MELSVVAVVPKASVYSSGRAFAAALVQARRAFILFFVFALLETVGAHAQTTFGSILGTLHDPSGAVIPNATVTIVNIGTSARRSVQTSGDGSYTFVNLEPARYKLSADAKGFKKVEYPALVLTARQTIRVDVTVQIGTQDQTVEVLDNVAVINTEVSNLVETKSGQELVDLPVAIASRASGSTSPITTLTTQPGVVVDNSGNLSIAGAKPSTLSVSLDGISTMSPRVSSPIAELFPSFGSISEIRVSAVNNAAEYGGVSDITTVSKSGTNSWHGGLFENNQVSALNAKSPFAVTKPKLVMNDFGISVGGPVILPHFYNGHNRTFFFATYEGLRLPQQQTITESVPSDSLRSGDLSVYTTKILNPATGTAFTNNQVPVSTIASRVLQYLYPRANYGATNAIANNYVANVSTPIESNQGDIRLDQNIGTRQSVFARFSYKRRQSEAVSSGTPLAGPTIMPENDYALTVAYNYILTTSLVNELRAGLSGSNSSSYFGISASTIQQELGLQLPGSAPQGNVVPAFSITGFQGTGDGNSSYSRARTVQLIDNLTYTRGRHTLKFGGDLRFLSAYYNNNWANYRLGTYTFNNTATKSIIGNAYAAFLLGIPDSDSVATVTETDSSGSSHHLAFYVQDDWKVTPRLTLNYGLRWEYHPMFSDGLGNTANFLPDSYSIVNGTTVHGAVVVPDSRINSIDTDFSAAVSPTPFVRATDAGLPQTLRFSQKTDFAPRAGFAWRLDDKTVLRGGYGRFIETELGMLLYAGWGVPTGYAGKFTNTIVNGQPTLSFPYPFPSKLSSATGSAQFLSAVDTHYHDPYIQQWNLTVERNLGASFGLRLSYDGNRGTNLGVSIDANQVPANTIGYAAASVGRPYPLWSFVRLNESAGRSNYNAFTTEINHRLYMGVQFQSSYSWAKNLSNNAGWNPTAYANEMGGVLTDRLHPNLDYGNVAYNRRHRSLSTFLYDLPFGQGKRLLGNAAPALNAIVGGWEVAGVVLFQTGPFLTVTTSGSDPAGNNFTNNVGGIRADLVAGQSLYPTTKNISHWLNSAAFATPASNIGRASNSPVGVVNGPGTEAVSLSLFKSFQFRNTGKLQIGAAAANVLNHRNFGNPTLLLTSAAFGTITSTQTAEGVGPRALQLSGRVTF